MPGKRVFKRKSGLRDARLIIIAAEGEITEKVYFNGLKDYYKNPRVHVEVLSPKKLSWRWTLFVLNTNYAKVTISYGLSLM